MPDSRNIRRRRFVWMAAGAALAPACWAPALAATAVGDERFVALRSSLSGTVTAIDRSTRLLAVRGPAGLHTYRVDGKVQAFDGLKVGDSVRLDYVAGLGLTVRRRREGANPPAAPTASSGQDPDKRVTMVTRVRAVDADKGTMTLECPQGQCPIGPVAEFKVQDATDLAGIRVGDTVVAVLYELVVVEVETAPR